MHILLKGKVKIRMFFMNSSKADNTEVHSSHPDSNNMLNELWILCDRTFI